MYKSFPIPKTDGVILFCWGLAILLLFGPGTSVWAQADAGGFEKLKQRLVADGFDPLEIAPIYSQPEVCFEPRKVAPFFVYKEADLNYDQFAAPTYIKKAREYMDRQANHLLAAQKDYGVDPEVIAAIILVETRLGTYIGGSRILNTLSSLAALADSDKRNLLWAEISDTRKLSRKRFEKRALRKSKWAYEELKAFLRYSRREGFDPAEVRGSFAGALGIAQFMPTNILAYARDGNDDGRIDLFDHADAIVSIANYLKHYGWRPGIKRRQAYKVVWEYNHSRYYVDIVLKVAALLKG